MVSVSCIQSVYSDKLLYLGAVFDDFIALMRREKKSTWVVEVYHGWLLFDAKLSEILDFFYVFFQDFMWSSWVFMQMWWNLVVVTINMVKTGHDKFFNHKELWCNASLVEVLKVV